MLEVAGLVEAILHLHRPTPCYNGLGAPKNDACTECGGEWPCATLRLVAEVTGSALPNPQSTGTWEDSPAAEGAISYVGEGRPLTIEELQALDAEVRGG